jgi:hypothetical protein
MVQNIATEIVKWRWRSGSKSLIFLGFIGYPDQPALARQRTMIVLLAAISDCQTIRSVPRIVKEYVTDM